MTELPKKNNGIDGGSLSKSNGGGGFGGGNHQNFLGDPADFEPVQLESDAGPRWSKLPLAITRSRADAWFGEFSHYSVASTAEQTPESLRPNDPESNDDLLFDCFVSEWSDFGEQQSLFESPLGKRILAILKKLGASGELFALKQVSKTSLVDQSDEAALSRGEVGRNDNLWVGTWGTDFGTNVLHQLKIFKDSEGIETAVWFCDAIFATRSLDITRTKDHYLNYIQDDPEGQSFKHYLKKRIWPQFAKLLFFLAETPYPSAVMREMPRESAFTSIPKSKWPQPFATFDSHKLAVASISAASDLAGKGSAFHFYIHPAVISTGWKIQDSDDATLERQIVFASSAVSNLATILEDGFRNHNTPDAIANWDAWLGSTSIWAQDSPDKNKIHGGVSRWIPGTQIGSLLDKTAYIYGRSKGSEREMRWLSDNGAGERAASAINTLAYSHLIPRSEFDLAEEYLQAAIKLEVLKETTNALTNLGLLYMKSGNVKDAERTLLEALGREDKFSEGEASHYLGLLYRDQVRLEDSKAMFTRSAQSLDQEFAARSRAQLDGKEATGKLVETTTPQVGDSFDISVPKFCIECGCKFPTDSARFCPDCGTKR